MTAQEKRRLYRLHFNLKNKGNEVNARARSVTRRAKELPPIEQRHCDELLKAGYCVSDAIFYPYNFTQKRNKNFGRKKL